MPLSMTLGATTATSQVLNFSGYAGTDKIRIQYASRIDFKNVVAPTYEISAAAAHTMQAINQDARYFVRARLVKQNGDLEDWVGPLGFYTPVAAARVTTPGQVLIKPALVVVPERMWDLSQVGTSFPGHPLQNLLHDGPTAWRGYGPETVKVRFSNGGIPIDTIALLSTNLPEKGTGRSVIIRASNTSPTMASDIGYTSSFADLRASENLPGRPGYHFLANLGAARSFQYWEIRIEAPVPGGLFQIGHLIAGLSRASKNHSVDMTETPIDFADFDRMRDGNPIRMSGLRGRRVDFDISMLTQAQYETLYRDLYQRVGLSDPLLVVPNSKEGAFLHDRILYGVPQQYRATNPASPYYSLGMSIDSII